jgi:hypothetical protein
MTRKWSCFAITTWVNNSEVDEVTPPHPCCLFAPHVNEISSIHAFMVITTSGHFGYAG